MRGLLSPRVCTRAYVAVLEAFFYFYRALERMLIPAVSELLAGLPQADYRYVPRSPLLGKDLVDLDVLPLPSKPGSEAPPLPDTDSTGATLGILYVLEGSTQGGRIIAPRLAQALGVGPTQGCRFFSLHAATNSGWLGFIQMLNTLEASPSIIKPAVSAADSTFEGLHRYLDSSPRMESQQV